MLLKSLEIQGFKSFAKKGIMEFQTPITAIVGPNGSGKSNVAEAFRFVLGEQSVKSMRGKRGEDLIFNGPDQAGRINRAGVKVVFDNSKRVFGIDFDEISIERVVHRDGVNEYIINGSNVRLRDVAELLAHANIGSSGHHIISQGEADRILSASIYERREMIEDALGLKVYQYKKQESLNKLDKTETTMREVELLRKELSPHLKFLRSQIAKIEKVREWREELRTKYREYFANESGYIEYEEKSITKYLQEPEKILRDMVAELGKLQNTESQVGDSNINKLSASLIGREQSLKEAKLAHDDLVKEHSRINGEIQALERVRSRAEQHNNTASIPVGEIEKLQRDFENAIKDHEQNSIKEIIDYINSKITNLIKHFSAHTQKDEVDVDIFRLNEQREQIKEKEISTRDLVHRLESEIYGLREDISRQRNIIQESEKDSLRLQARIQETKAQLSVLYAKRDALYREKSVFENELKEAYVLVGREAADYTPVNYEADGETTPVSRESQSELRKIIEKIKIRIEESGVGGSGDIEKEFKDTEERDKFLARELEDITKAKESILTLITDLDTTLAKEFESGLKSINENFKNYFVSMFGGGDASLALYTEPNRKSNDDISDNEEKIIKQGIDINVSLPRKKTKGLMMLSGGERALTSIALLFAISQVKPPPFIILDETDAALDEANSRKYGDMIELLSNQSQLILITHNRETMSRAGVLYGVTMNNHGSSGLLSIQLQEAVRVAK